MSISYYTGAKLQIDKLDLDIKCVGCGGQKGLDLIRPYIPRRVMKKDTYVVQCPCCNLLQACPMPDAVELTRFYEHQYREAGTTGFSEPTITNRHSSQAEYIARVVSKLEKRPNRILEVGAGFGQLLSLF
jgi:hypothetical protein